MQPQTDLAFEFQLNGRVTLTVPVNGLHQNNLTVTTDIVNIDGGSQKLSALNPGLVAALNTAIKNLIISNQQVPV